MGYVFNITNSIPTLNCKKTLRESVARLRKHFKHSTVQEANNFIIKTGNTTLN